MVCVCGMYRDSARGGEAPLKNCTELGNSGVGGRNSLCMLVLIMEFFFCSRGGVRVMDGIEGEMGIWMGLL